MSRNRKPTKQDRQPPAGLRWLPPAPNGERRAESTETPAACRACGSTHLRGYGPRRARVVDAPRAGAPARLQVERYRWRCNDCLTMTLAPIEGLANNHRWTRAAVEWLMGQALLRPTSELAQALGVVTQTVRRVVTNQHAQWEAARHLVAPETLERGTIRLLRKPRAAWVNPEAGTLVELCTHATGQEVQAIQDRWPKALVRDASPTTDAQLQALAGQLEAARGTTSFPAVRGWLLLRPERQVWRPSPNTTGQYSFGTSLSAVRADLGGAQPNAEQYAAIGVTRAAGGPANRRTVRN